MGVPLTGPLSQLKLAREAKHADYNGSQSMGTISLYDLVNGGKLKGSTVDYPTVNQNCLPNPVDRDSYTELLQIYKYNNGTTTGPFTHYVSYAQAATASVVGDGDTLYNEASLSTTISALSGSNIYWYQNVSGLSVTELVCGNGDGSAWESTAAGVMSNLTCGSP